MIHGNSCVPWGVLAPSLETYEMIPYCAVVERADPAVSALVLRDLAPPLDLLDELLGVHDLVEIRDLVATPFDHYENVVGSF